MKIAACLIVKNEARDIAEWIAYHALAGIDAFLVYDNASSDGTAAALQAAAGLYDVRVTPWRTPSGLGQVEAYSHAARTNRREFDWIVVIDSDEFIVVHQPDTLRTLCGNTNAAAVGINWANPAGHRVVHPPRRDRLSRQPPRQVDVPPQRVRRLHQPARFHGRWPDRPTRRLPARMGP